MKDYGYFLIVVLALAATWNASGLASAVGRGRDSAALEGTCQAELRKIEAERAAIVTRTPAAAGSGDVDAILARRRPECLPGDLNRIARGAAGDAAVWAAGAVEASRERRTGQHGAAGSVGASVSLSDFRMAQVTTVTRHEPRERGTASSAPATSYASSAR